MSFGKRGTSGGTAAAARRPARLVSPPARSDRNGPAANGPAPAAAPTEPAAAPPRRRLLPIILLAGLAVPLGMNWMMRNAQRNIEAQLGKADENGQNPAVTPKLPPPKEVAVASRRDPLGKIVDVQTGDPEIAAARAKARASLDAFWARHAAPAPGEDNFTLKASLPTRNGSLEHIWVADIKRDGETVIGRLSNQPRDLEGLKMGSPVTFHEQQISDWSFRRNGKIVGNETMRPLIAKLPPAEAERYRAMLETP